MNYNSGLVIGSVDKNFPDREISPVSVNRDCRVETSHCNSCWKLASQCDLVRSHFPIGSNFNMKTTTLNFICSVTEDFTKAV